MKQLSVEVFVKDFSVEKNPFYIFVGRKYLLTAKWKLLSEYRIHKQPV